MAALIPFKTVAFLSTVKKAIAANSRNRHCHLAHISRMLNWMEVKEKYFLNKFRFFWTIIIVTSRCRLILAQENDWQAWVNLAIMKSGENSTNIFTFVICGKDVISYPVLNSYLSSIHSNLACTPQLTAACMPLGTTLSITTQKPQSAKRHLFWCWELQWGPVACTINILWSSYDSHERCLYYKWSLVP